MARVNTSADGGSQAEDAQAAEFGAALRQTRIAHGRELSDVAAQLRIRQVYLQAIEAGRFDDLPGPTYAIGFVRAYADYLGLDEGEVVKRYKDLRGGAGAPANLVPPAPVTEGRLPTGSILLLAAVLAAAAYGGWYYLSMKGRNPGEMVAALPERIAAMVGLKQEHVPSATPPAVTPPADAPAATASSQPPPGGEAKSEPPPAETATAAPAPSFKPMASSTPAGAAAPQVPPPVEPSTTEDIASPPADKPAATSTAEATPGPAADTPAERAAEPVPPAAPPEQAAPSSPPVESAGVPSAPPLPDATSQTAARAEPATNGRIMLRASASSWVEIRNAEDRRVFSRLMRAGETYAVPPTPGLTLTTGNAGGLAIVVDGKALPPLGEPGDVRRDLALDAETLLRQAGSTP